MVHGTCTKTPTYLVVPLPHPATSLHAKISQSYPFNNPRQTCPCPKLTVPLTAPVIPHHLLSPLPPAPMAERYEAQSCPLAVIVRRSLCPEKLGSNPGQGSKGINFSGWHGLDMSVTVTKRR